MPETSDVVLTPPVPAFLGVCVYGGGGDGVLTVNLGTGYGHHVHFEAIGSSELGMLSLSPGNLASQRASADSPGCRLERRWASKCSFLILMCGATSWYRIFLSDVSVSLSRKAPYVLTRTSSSLLIFFHLALTFSIVSLKTN